MSRDAGERSEWLTSFALCLTLGTLLFATISVEPSAGNSEKESTTDATPKVTEAIQPESSVTYDQLHRHVQGHLAPDDIILNRKKDDVGGRYKPFTFTHGDHTEYTEFGCGFCHHKAIANGKPVTCSTSGCHDVGGKIETRAKTKWAHKGGSVKEIAGVGVSCRACHKNEGARTGCTDCHAKQ
jgi:hypothetical protein